MNFNKFELDILNKFLEFSSKNWDKLKKQLLSASVKKMEYTGVWFYMEINVLNNTAPISLKDNIKISDILWIRDNIPSLGFILYIENWYLSMLECFSYNDKEISFENIKLVYEWWDVRNIDQRLL